MAYTNKEDQAAAARRHYEKNKAAIKARAKKWTADEKARRRNVLAELKESTPCMDCGNSYPHYVMDFDHRDDKLFTISNSLTKNWDVIMAEVAKCDIVCSNCHRTRTFLRNSAARVSGS